MCNTESLHGIARHHAPPAVPSLPSERLRQRVELWWWSLVGAAFWLVILIVAVIARRYSR